MVRVSCLAGAVGIEPTSLVLETSVLPLNEAPLGSKGAGRLSFGRVTIKAPTKNVNGN